MRGHSPSVHWQGLSRPEDDFARFCDACELPGHLGMELGEPIASGSGGSSAHGGASTETSDADADCAACAQDAAMERGCTAECFEPVPDCLDCARELPVGSVPVRDGPPWS